MGHPGNRLKTQRSTPMQQWKCNICGYEFESDEEDPKCPMCFGSCQPQQES